MRYQGLHVKKLSSFSLLIVLAAGCANNDLVVRRQTTLEGRLEQVVLSQNLAMSRLADIDAEVKAVQEQISRLSSGQASMLNMQDRVTQLKQRLDKVESDLPPVLATRIEVVNKGGSSDDPDGRIQDAYLKAFGLFSANNFAAAADAFTLFLKSYPSGEYAVNSRYWLGECYFSDGKYRQAADVLTRFVADYPGNRKMADALLMLGSSLLRLNERTKGKEALQLLMEKFPGSEAAVRASEQLGRP